MLGVVHIDMHEHHQHQHDDPAAVDPQHPGEAGGGVKLGDDLRALAALPGPALEPADHTDDDVVHHQGEQRLIGVPPGLEKGGNQGPHAAGNGSGDAHDHQQHGGGKAARPEEGEVAGGDGPRGDLALGADVPKAHLKAGGDGQGAAQQGNGDLHRLADGALFPQGAGDHGAVSGDGIGPRQAHYQGPQQQGEEDGPTPDAPDLPALHAVPLGKADEGNLFLVAHASASFPPKALISRPICSLAADRASTTPLTFPPQRTRIRSHSSSSTSRSSPT